MQERATLLPTYHWERSAKGRESGKYRCQGPNVKGHSLGFSDSSPKRQTKPHTNPVPFIVQELETDEETRET